MTILNETVTIEFTKAEALRAYAVIGRSTGDFKEAGFYTQLAKALGLKRGEMLTITGALPVVPYYDIQDRMESAYTNHIDSLIRDETRLQSLKESLELIKESIAEIESRI